MTYWNSLDRERLRDKGISLSEADRQVNLLRRGPQARRVLRPCALGDGIISLDEKTRLAYGELFARKQESLVGGKFIPASGAASRMFQPVREALDDLSRGSTESAEALLTLMEKTPFGSGLGAEVDLEKALKELLLLADKPKVITPWHRSTEQDRTPLREHVAEGLHYLQGESTHFHFTVSEEHRGGVETVAREVESQFGTKIGISFQKASTDTLALDDTGELLRDDRDHLVFRPGGHGALIENLNEFPGDFAFIRTIDNVRPESAHAEVGEWQAALGGLLLELRERMGVALLAARRGESQGAREALEMAVEVFGRNRENLERALGKGPETLADCLDRPLRVCGVVANQGEPGGGPFWIESADGFAAKQIVETAEIDDSPEQQSILAQATHFNPVLLGCALSDISGKAWDLHHFIDPNAVFFANKYYQGRPCLALERPGLWNGAMEKWLTVFVEVPLSNFAPVKNLTDLAREAHQG